MIAVNNAEVRINGKKGKVLADFAFLVHGMSEAVGFDETLETCILGLYAKKPEDLQAIHKKLEEAGLAATGINPPD